MTKDEAKALVEAHYPSWNILKLVTNKDGSSYTAELQRLEDEKKRTLLIRNGQISLVSV
jgi:hypothetical protein